MMRITVFSDYALRVLTYLGVNGEQRTTVSEIATAYGISHSHLMKVVQSLAALGYVETTRGKGGGLKLARPPAEISLGQVLRATEEGSALVECFGPDSACRILSGCTLPRIFNEAIESFFATLDRYTLADLLVRPEQLVELLKIPHPA